MKIICITVALPLVCAFSLYAIGWVAFHFGYMDPLAPTAYFANPGSLTWDFQMISSGFLMLGLAVDIILGVIFIAWLLWLFRGILKRYLLRGLS